MKSCLFKTYTNQNGRMIANAKQLGQFHEWGKTFEEFDNGAVEMSIGLVEDVSGQMHEVLPADIQFAKSEINNLKPLPDDYQIDN